MSDEINPKLKTRLDELKDTPARDPRAIARGRARFLAQAASTLVPVSDRGKMRHKGWNLFPRKENFSTMKAVTAILIALTLLVVGSASAYAAQDDLPNESLYGLKILTENIRLLANTDPDREVELLMEMVQIRLQEMTAMASQGEIPPAKVAERLELHIQLALQVTAGMDDSAMQGTLERVRKTLQEQDRLMIQLQEQTSVEPDPLMSQTRETLELHIRLVDSGMTDPEGFRNAIRNEQQNQYGQTETPTPCQGNCPPAGADGIRGTPTPGAGNGEPNPAHTPDPHGSGGGGGNKP